MLPMQQIRHDSLTQLWRHVTAGCPPFLCFWVNWVAALAIVVCYDQSARPLSFPQLIPSRRIYYVFISCTALLCFAVISKLLHRASNTDNKLSTVYLCFFSSLLQRFTLLCDNKSPVWAETGEASSEKVLEARATEKQDWKAVQRCASKTDHLPIWINTNYTI